MVSLSKVVEAIRMAVDVSITLRQVLDGRHAVKQFCVPGL